MLMKKHEKRSEGSRPLIPTKNPAPPILRVDLLPGGDDPLVCRLYVKDNNGVIIPTADIDAIAYPGYEFRYWVKVANHVTKTWDMGVFSPPVSQPLNQSATLCLNQDHCSGAEIQVCIIVEQKPAGRGDPNPRFDKCGVSIDVVGFSRITSPHTT